MYRFFYFLVIIIVPVVFGWWLFVPLALLSVYLAKLPYEIILAGAILDTVYYFGDDFLLKHQFTLFATVLIIGALFLSNRIHWDKKI